MNVLTFAPKSPTVEGLPAELQQIVDALWRQWIAKRERNALKTSYLEMKNRFKDLRVALPPSLVDELDVTSGWAEKAVHELTNRIVLEGLVMADGSDVSDLGLEDVLEANRFEVEFRQAIVSSAALSTVFVTTTSGDVLRGEPSELVRFHSANYATGIWDNRMRALSAGLTIDSVDDMFYPTQFTVYLSHTIFTCAKYGDKWLVIWTGNNPTRRVLMEQLPLRPTLDRPFGKSRIDRQVMSLIDRKMAASARLDVHSEMFASLKLMLMGADEDTFKDNDGNEIPLWSFIMGRVNGIPKDADGETPTLETILAQSPEPHIATLRQLTSEFSGHTGVPMSQLGISTDNAESADAKSEARQDIVNDAEIQHIIYGSALKRVFENLVMLRENTSTPPEEMKQLRLQWRRPDRATLSSLADAGSKQVAAVPGLAETEVGMEMIGMTRDQITRAKSELRAAASPSILDRVLARETASATSDVATAPPLTPARTPQT